MEERLQKLLSTRLEISRRAADALVTGGRVTLNGRVAVPGDKADGDRDAICVDGAPIPGPVGRKVYIMLNKPVGYVTTMSDEKGRKTVRELVSDLPERVYPVGRLDINSEGLLIMTNDGALANRLMHPSFEKEKTYRVTVAGNMEKGLIALSEPMELDGDVLAVPRVQVLRPGVVDITIHEGKNRQIRRMCEAAGLRVTRLTRISEGGVSLGRLKKGTWRYLTRAELDKLRGK